MPAAKATLLLIIWGALAPMPALAVSQRWADRDWDECRGVDTGRAILACTRLLRDRSETPQQRGEAYFRRGLNLRINGETARAIGDYTELIRLAPKYAHAYVLRGNAWRAFGDHDRAIADYTQAIGLDPKAPDAYAGRAASWEVKEEHDPAIADYTEAIKLEPKEADYYDHRAWAWMYKAEVDKADADMAQAIELDPQNAAYQRYRGYFLFVKGDFPAAADAFSRSLEGEKKNWTSDDAYAVAWRFLARERSATSGRDELVRDSAKLNTGAWPFPVVDFYLGRRSAHDLQKVAATADEQCEAAFYLGQSLLISDARSAAADALDRAVHTCEKTEMEYWAAVSDLKGTGGKP